ncbi:MAG: quinolinate synthase NadA [Halanaerobiaceae bacterium]
MAADRKTEKEELRQKIKSLRKDRNAVILAHNYQNGEIQDIADYVGDSLGLSQQAAKTDAEVIVFCGVKFMAESAKILSPQKIVLLPEIESLCPMAGMVEPHGLREKKKQYPEAAVVTYVNSTAEVKAESDICCTSSNALKIVESIPEKQILFVPDQNLGNYVAARTDKEIITWNGYCTTHHRVKPEEIKKVKEKHPEAPILVHPECVSGVVAGADYVGSTAGILDYARNSKAQKLIIGTEQGLLHRLKKENPDKRFYTLSPSLICPNMKKINLQKLADSLKNMETKIEIPEKIRKKAEQALNRMLEVTG